MPSPIYNEPMIRPFIVSEADYSRDNIVLTRDGAPFRSGTVLTKLESGKYVRYLADRAAGTAGAVLCRYLSGGVGDTKVVAITNAASINRLELDGLDESAEVDLRIRNITVRSQR